jgi:hypothetical protein
VSVNNDVEVKIKGTEVEEDRRMFDGIDVVCKRKIKGTR